jgi:hypothetical protein
VPNSAPRAVMALTRVSGRCQTLRDRLAHLRAR